MHLSSQLDALGDFLRSTAHVWRPRAFYGLPLAWESVFPDVVAFIEALPERVDGASDDTSWTVSGPAVLRDWAARGAALSALPPLSASPADELDITHMTGRKAPQIGHFVGVVRGRLPASTSHIVDWCSGKSHLGRSLARVTRLPLVALERDAALCEVGRTLSAAAGVPADFVNVDVLTPAATPHLTGAAAAVAAFLRSDRALRWWTLLCTLALAAGSVPRRSALL